MSSSISSHVVSLYRRDDLERELKQCGVGVTYLDLPEGKGSRAWPNTVPRLLHTMKVFRPDVVHTSLTLGNLVGQIGARLRGVPVVSTLVLSGDDGLMRRYQPGAATWRATMMRQVCSVAARGKRVYFRALTRDAAATNAQRLRLPPDRIVVIPRGVPAPKMEAPPPRWLLGLPPRGRIVLNVGRMVPQKGQVLLVRAFDRVVQQAPDAQLVILGKEGSSTGDVVREIRAAGLEDRVHILGYTEAVGDYFRHAAVFAFSSLMEGLGTAVLEAMSHGVPVAAFDIPPVREVTAGGRVADLVPVGDTGALADAIVDALEGNRQSHAEQATKLVAERFSLPVVARRVEDVLLGVAEEPPA